MTVNESKDVGLPPLCRGTWGLASASLQDLAGDRGSEMAVVKRFEAWQWFHTSGRFEGFGGLQIAPDEKGQ